MSPKALGLDKARGALIAAIDAASPATQAGLRPGDVILSYDGKPVDRSRQLPRLVADSAPDKPVKLTIWRDGKEDEVTLTVVAYNPNRPQPQPPAPEQPKPPATVDALGLKVARLTPRAAQTVLAAGQRARHRHRRGAAEQPRRHSGLAWRADLIVAVGDAPVSVPDDVLAQIAVPRRPGARTC